MTHPTDSDLLNSVLQLITDHGVADLGEGNSFRPLRFPLARRQHPTEANDVIVIGTPSSQLSLLNWPNDAVSARSMTTQRVP